MEEFLKTYKDEEGNLVYWPKIQRMSINFETSITIDYKEMVIFDQVFRTSNHTDVLSIMEGALISVLNVENPEYIQEIGVERIEAHLIRHPNTILPSQLKSHHIGQLMTVKGIVVDASRVTPLLKQGMFLCRICQNEIPQPQEHGVITEPALCPICTKKTPMRLVDSKSQFVEFQCCTIQDEESPPGDIPTTVEARLENDLAGLAIQGDTVSLTGILKSSPRRDSLATFDYYLDVVGVEQHDRTVRHDVKPRIKHEEDLEDLLQRNPDLLGFGLIVLGRQVKTETGWIDLLLEAPDTGIVVVELKVEKADRKVVAQIQEYMTWAQQKYGSQRKVRGIIIANGFAERMVLSLQGSKYHIRLVDLSTITN